MAKCIPTTKSCSTIESLICPHYTPGMYVQTTFDPYTTHALYGVRKSEVDMYKSRIKKIGGKYIRVVSASSKECI